MVQMASGTLSGHTPNGAIGSRSQPEPPLRSTMKLGYCLLLGRHLSWCLQGANMEPIRRGQFRMNPLLRFAVSLDPAPDAVHNVCLNPGPNGGVKVAPALLGGLGGHGRVPAGCPAKSPETSGSGEVRGPASPSLALNCGPWGEWACTPPLRRQPA